MGLHERVKVVQDELEEYRSTCRAKEIQRDAVATLVRDYDTDIDALTEAEINYGKATIAFKNISDKRNEEAKQMLEDVLNWALSNIPLEQRYKARLDERESGRSGREMVIVLRDLDTGNERSLRNQTGTAISQIVSFLMNIIVIKISGASRIMVLDEVFSGLQDKETIRMFGEILVALSKNEGFQFIMVEHKSELAEIEGITQIKLALDNYEEGLKIIQ